MSKTLSVFIYLYYNLDAGGVDEMRGLKCFVPAKILMS